MKFMKGSSEILLGRGQDDLGRGSAARSALFLCPHSQQGQVIPHGSAVPCKFAFRFAWHTPVLLAPGEGLVATAEYGPPNIFQPFTTHLCFAFSTLTHDALHDLNLPLANQLSIFNLGSCSALLLAAITGHR